MNIKILVVTHKPYWMPNDSIYLPIQAGAAINTKLDFIGDDTGDNISNKNKNYCELTAMYWAWKNLDSDYIGLVHYRRHFGTPPKRNKHSTKKLREQVYSSKDIEDMLKHSDVILPRAYIHPKNETIKSYYADSHIEKDIILTRAIISDFYPSYIDTFDKFMNSDRGHYCNMFVMKKDIFDKYSNWLFDILFELEKRTDISDYDDYQKRIFGFVSERLLDVFLIHNNINSIESSCIYLEPGPRLGFKQRLIRSINKRIDKVKNLL